MSFVNSFALVYPQGRTVFAQVIVKWVREHTVLPYGVDCTDIGQLRYPFYPPFILHPPLSILNSKREPKSVPFLLTAADFSYES